MSKIYSLIISNEPYVHLGENKHIHLIVKLKNAQFTVKAEHIDHVYTVMKSGPNLIYSYCFCFFLKSESGKYYIFIFRSDPGHFHM